jgi:hypothetical protein
MLGGAYINWGVKKINNAFKRCRYAGIKAPGDGMSRVGNGTVHCGLAMAS